MLDPIKKAALIQAIEDMVARIVSSSGLTTQQVQDLITGRIADDATAGAGASTTQLASVRGAYLAAQKALTDELSGNPAGLQTLLEIATAIVTNQDDITDLTALVTALGNAFNYVGVLDEGGVDAGSAFDLDTLPAGGKDAGDYYKVTVGGYFIQANTNGGVAFLVNTNDNLVWNTTGSVDIIDNTQGAVLGTASEIEVTGNADTGFTVAIAAAFKARVTALESVVTSLNAFGVLTPVAYAAVVADIALTTVNAIAVGTYHVVGTATGLGIPSAVVAEGTTPVAGMMKVVDVGGGEKQLQLSVVVEGRTLTKTIKGDVADGTTPTNASVIGWSDHVSDDNELMDALIAAFDAAAQP